MSNRYMDFHHHFVPRVYREWCSVNVPSLMLPAWKPEQSLAFLEENGIECAWLSLTAPGVYFSSQKQARELARVSNEEAAGIKQQYPGRFKVFGVLPFPDIQGSIDEITYCLGPLQMDGILLFSNTEGVYPSAVQHRGLFEELNRRNAFVFLHPAMDVYKPGGQQGDIQDVLSAAFAYPFDVSYLFCRFLAEDLFEDYKNIRFLLAHGAAVVPFLIDRISKAAYAKGIKPRMGRILFDLMTKRNRGLEYLKRCSVDLTGCSGPVSMAALKSCVPDENLAAGSNFLWAGNSAAERELRAGLENCSA